MPTPLERFDAESVRDSWNFAADAYHQRQASGKDYYRFEFFGPAQVALCGDVKGMRLLDVGCGSGYFAREMAQRGAYVTAIDISPRMIELAERFEGNTSYTIDYQVRDAADMQTGFAPASFDVATSCIALIDMPEPGKVLRGVHSVLRPGGRFIASITHPWSDTPFRAWERDDKGQKRWLCIDRYFERGPLEYKWQGGSYDFATPSLHATLEDWFDWILAAGFQVRAVREPRPTEQALRKHPDLEDATRVPYFLIFDLIRTI